MTRVRDYEKEYDQYHSSPEQKRNRALRNNARRRALREGRAEKGDGTEVDHIKPLSKGGKNGKKNERVVSRETNRKKYDK